MDKIRIPNIEHLLPPQRRAGAAPVSREAIAYHEAGHVLVAHYYHREVLHAALDPWGGQGAANHVEFAPNRALQLLARRAGSPTQLWPEALRQTQITVRILFGGPAAQALQQRVPFDQIDGGDDHHNAARTLWFLEDVRRKHVELAETDTEHRRPGALEALAGDARRVVERTANEPFLTRIADRLLSATRIEGEEIRELLAGMERQDPMAEIHRQLTRWRLDTDQDR